MSHAERVVDFEIMHTLGAVGKVNGWIEGEEIAAGVIVGKWISGAACVTEIDVLILGTQT